jgi:hypothetical protein
MFKTLSTWSMVAVMVTSTSCFGVNPNSSPYFSRHPCLEKVKSMGEQLSPISHEKSDGIFRTFGTAGGPAHVVDISQATVHQLTRSNEMGDELCSIVDFEALKKTLATVVDSAGSLDEIEAWLKSQQYVKSVQLADYLLKSNPPQRDFIIEFSMEDGSTVKKIVNIFDLGNQQFQFHTLRDE